MSFVPASLLALFSFGLWGLFTKQAVLHINYKSALIYQTLGVLIVGMFTLALVKFKPTTNLKGLSYSLLTGAAYSIGCLFYFIAASKGKIITVVTLTALYPLITIALAYILLHEAVSSKQVLGICFGLLAIFLMST
ncbi:MAG TPA: GRP family sugar transporter [Gammaproteobacteria bacterium]|nr:GRP family sugar transporter [Gammaproteobacteria bacterium]